MKERNFIGSIQMRWRRGLLNLTARLYWKIAGRDIPQKTSYCILCKASNDILRNPHYAFRIPHLDNNTPFLRGCQFSKCSLSSERARRTQTGTHPSHAGLLPGERGQL